LAYQDRVIDGDDDMVQNWFDSFEGWVEGKGEVSGSNRIFQTRRGYLGLSCDHIRAGDKVTLLRGGHLPFLLREAGSVQRPNNPGLETKAETTQLVNHKLIGGYCYIHGLSDGQGLEIAEREGIAPQDICLI
jgi:hypothetical protein